MLDENIHGLMDARDMSLFHLFIELYSCQASEVRKIKEKLKTTIEYGKSKLRFHH